MRISFPNLGAALSFHDLQVKIETDLNQEPGFGASNSNDIFKIFIGSLQGQQIGALNFSTSDVNVSSSSNAVLGNTSSLIVIGDTSANSVLCQQTVQSLIDTSLSDSQKTKLDSLLNIIASPLPGDITTTTLTQNELDRLNPLKQSGVDATAATELSTPGGILSRVLRYAIPIAGTILFVMIVWGGFEMLSGAASSKSKEAGRQRVTSAIIGFFLLFASYWIVQIIQLIFGVRILN